MKKSVTAGILAILIFQASGWLAAQEQGNLIRKPFQIGLFPPLSTNGTDAGKCINSISINGIAGFSAGLEGIEFGGFMNIETIYMKGAQFSGFMNITGRTEGAQLSGFLNISGKVKGAQVSGFMNIADTVEGAQVAGFINIAGSVKGTQVGFINVADRVEAGVPVGFISVVGNGYRAFELSVSETWNASLGYRIGVDKFFTQFMVGSRFAGDDRFWGAGFGIGSRFRISDYFTGSADLTSWQLIEGGRLWAERPTLLEQLRVTIEGRIAGSLKWFAGPSFTLLVAPFEYPEPDYLNALHPWAVYENASGVSYVKMWPGVSGGIRF